MKEPLIITLELEEEAKQFFTEQRTAYFPKHINYLDAHLTLFHAVPPGEMIIYSTIESVCKRVSFDIVVSDLRNIGNGVAYSIESKELQEMHVVMQKAFDPFLVSKDRQILWPHITIQNKATAFKAQMLHEKLQKEFKPFSCKATGIGIYKYLGGPWEKTGNVLFNIE